MLSDRIEFELFKMTGTAGVPLLDNLEDSAAEHAAPVVDAAKE